MLNTQRERAPGAFAVYAARATSARNRLHNISSLLSLHCTALAQRNTHIDIERFLLVSGLWVAGQEIKVGHDLMRAVVYVRPERGQQLLTNDLSHTPMHSRDKREVRKQQLF